MSDLIRKLVVGLGNPGRKYQDNRHNIGFLVVDELMRRRKLEFKEVKRSYWASSGAFAVDHPVFLKPMTYMNLSGEALVLWAEKNGANLSGAPEPGPLVEVQGPEESVSDPTAPVPESVLLPHTAPLPEPVRPLVICDDLALPLGAVRLRGKGSSGGQNGILSIIEHLEGEVFPRLRLGIAPQDGAVDPQLWPDYVLADFDENEHDVVRDVVRHAADTVEHWLENGLAATASRFNRRRAPEKPVSED